MIKNWKILDEEFKKDYYIQLNNFLEKEYKNKTIYPKKEDIFNAFKYFNFEDLKVVILGQDPYHEEGQAMGLSFSVPNDIKRPPSLNNIFKELESDLNIKNENNDLTSWAKQGVLLLNTVLTVEQGLANSHKNKGWEIFTDNVIKYIDENKNNVVFILWGNNAREKKKIIKNNYIIESNHPSPLSACRGFFGSKPFSRTNEYLKSKNINEIIWKN